MADISHGRVKNISFKDLFLLVLLSIFVVIACLIVWQAIDVFLLAFAALLLGIFLSTLGGFAKRITHLPYPLALALVLIVIVGLFVLTFWLYAPIITDQFNSLLEQMPVAIHKLKQILSGFIDLSFLENIDIRKDIFGNVRVLSQLSKVFSFTLGGIVGFVVFLFLGFYVSFSPLVYFEGFLKAFPPETQHRVRSLLSTIGKSLRYWLLGKFCSMIIVGALVYIGLLLLNVSLAFILGLIAGCLTFIPYVGPILSAVPAVMIAFIQSPLKAIYVILLYVCIYVVEGYLITPNIEQRTVSLPPAFTVFMQVLLVVLVGFLGLALATPITVVILAIFKNIRSKKQLA